MHKQRGEGSIEGISTDIGEGLDLDLIERALQREDGEKDKDVRSRLIPYADQLGITKPAGYKTAKKLITAMRQAISFKRTPNGASEDVHDNVVSNGSVGEPLEDGKTPHSEIVGALDELRAENVGGEVPQAAEPEPKPETGSIPTPVTTPERSKVDEEKVQAQKNREMLVNFGVMTQEEIGEVGDDSKKLKKMALTVLSVRKVVNPEEFFTIVATKQGRDRFRSMDQTLLKRDSENKIRPDRKSIILVDPEEMIKIGESLKLNGNKFKTLVQEYRDLTVDRNYQGDLKAALDEKQFQIHEAVYRRAQDIYKKALALCTPDEIQTALGNNKEGFLVALNNHPKLVDARRQEREERERRKSEQGVVVESASPAGEATRVETSAVVVPASDMETTRDEQQLTKNEIETAIVPPELDEKRADIERRRQKELENSPGVVEERELLIYAIKYYREDLDNPEWADDVIKKDLAVLNESPLEYFRHTLQQADALTKKDGLLRDEKERFQAAIDQINAINAKYDKELADLGKQTEPAQSLVDVTNSNTPEQSPETKRAFDEAMEKLAALRSKFFLDVSYFDELLDLKKMNSDQASQVEPRFRELSDTIQEVNKFSSNDLPQDLDQASRDKLDKLVYGLNGIFNGLKEKMEARVAGLSKPATATEALKMTETEAREMITPEDINGALDAWEKIFVIALVAGGQKDTTARAVALAMKEDQKDGIVGEMIKRLIG